MRSVASVLSLPVSCLCADTDSNTYLADHIFLRAVEVEASSIPVLLACRNRLVSQD